MPALGLKMRIDRLTSLIASVYQTGLQMWHKFTATTWDGSTDRLPDSSPVGTNTAALFTGRGLSFDGVNDVVTVGATGVTVKTVVFYAYPDTDTTAFMQLQSTGAVRVEISSGTLSAAGFTSPTLYVDGAASSTVAATTWQQIAVTSATGVSASNVLLGQSNTTYYGGDLSNVKFFSVELTAGQVAELYANPEQTLPTGVSAGDLVGWWPIYDDTSFPAINTPGVISGATNVNKLPSPCPQYALQTHSTITVFDGVDDYVDVTNSALRPAVNLSICLWVNLSTLASQNVIWQSGNPSAYATNNSQLRIETTGQVRFFGRTNTTFAATTDTLQANKWYHLSVVANGTDYKIYINGAQNGTQPSGVIGSDNTTGETIGKSSVGNFRGSIVDFRIYDSALSTSQISYLFSSGASGVNPGTNNLLARYTFLNQLNSTLLDDSANGRDGIIYGSPTFLTRPNGIGITTNVVNSNYFALNSAGYALATDAASLDITTDITLEAWVKPFTVASLQSAIGKNSAYALNITAGAKLQFQRWSSTTSATVSSSASLTADIWYHIAATYDGTTTKLYINGIQDTNSGAVTGAIDSTATDVLLGALTTSTNLFSGYLDSVKVYDEVLTAAQIKTNYNAEKGSHSNS